jgi:hypothetical protein
MLLKNRFKFCGNFISSSLLLCVLDLAILLVKFYTLNFSEFTDNVCMALTVFARILASQNKLYS